MYKHALIPLDGSKPAEAAIAHAEKLTRGCGTQDITLLRVVEHTKVVGPAQAIIYHAEHSPCEIISRPAMAAPESAAGILGSVADKVFKASTVPILIVGPHEKVRGA